MFNLKSLVNKITDRGVRESQSDSPARPEFEDDSSSKEAAEGFLCPKCMKAFPSPEDLHAHYQASHDSAEDSASYESATASPGFYGIHQEVGERYKLSRQRENCGELKERLTAEIQAITDITELQKSLLDALDSKSELQIEKENLEQRLELESRQSNTEKNTLKERLNLLDEQLKHRESIDDATVLRQELVAVQRAMDEMTQMRERERDMLESELTQFKLACAIEREQEELNMATTVAELNEIKETHGKVIASQNNLGHSFQTQQNEFQSAKEELAAYKTQMAEAKKRLVEMEKLLAAQMDQLESKDVEIKTAYAQVDFYKNQVQASKIQQDDVPVDQEISQKDISIKLLANEVLCHDVDAGGDLSTQENICMLADEQAAQRVVGSASDLLEQNTGDLKLTIVNLEEELKNMTQQFKETNKELEETSMVLTSTKTKNIHELSDMFKGVPLSDVAKKVYNVICDHATLSHALTQCRKQLDVATKDLFEGMGKIDQLEFNGTMAENSLHKLQQKYAELVLSHESLINMWKEMEQEKIALSSDLNNLRPDFERSEKTCESLQIRIEALTAEVEDREENKKRDLNKYSELEFELQGATELIAIRDGIIVDLQNANQDQLLEYLDLEQQLNATKNELTLMTANLAPLEAEIQAMAVKHTSFETVIFELEMRKAELELEQRNAEFLTEQTEETYRKDRCEMERKHADELANVTDRLALTEAGLNDQKISHHKFIAELEAEHLSNIEKKEQVIKELQKALDEVAGEKLALEALLQASQSEHKSLLEKYYTSCNEHDAHRRTIDDLRRRSDDSQSALHELGRENQILRLELEKLLGRKWTEDADVASCHLCRKEFTLLVRKHHCRNCGQIFCNECSTKNAQVANNKRPVRVCDGCFNELVAPASAGAI